jgi:dihydrofolate reductase
MGKKSCMRNVIVSEFVTLDNVMENPGGAEKFKHGGWTWPYWHDEIGKFKFDELFASDALLLGRVTYQGFAAAWPSRVDKGGFADRMNSLPKYVVSTFLEKVAWNLQMVIQE